MEDYVMKTHDFWYDLPEELIAQTPLEKRDNSRLLKLDRRTGAVEHHHFYDIIDYLQEGDCLIANNSRVLPARIYGIKQHTGARVEFLLLKRIEGDFWEAMVRPGSKLKSGAKVIFGDGILKATVLEVLENGKSINPLNYLTLPEK